MVEIDFLKMWRKFLDERGLMADRSAGNFEKDLLVLGRGSPRNLCK